VAFTELIHKHKHKRATMS